MKTLVLAFATILLTSFTIAESQIDTASEVEMSFFGIWRNMDGEFVQISRNMDNEITFQRIASNKLLQAKGNILSATEGKISVEREYPQQVEYISEYRFSPSKNTLVIMKPNSDQAWLFERIGQ